MQLVQARPVATAAAAGEASEEVAEAKVKVVTALVGLEKVVVEAEEMALPASKVVATMAEEGFSAKGQQVLVD